MRGVDRSLKQTNSDQLLASLDSPEFSQKDICKLAEAGLDPAGRANLPALLPWIRIVPDAFGPPPPGVVLRGKDIPILASAALCGADILLTGDERDFGQWFGRTLGGVKIVKSGSLEKEL